MAKGDARRLIIEAIQNETEAFHPSKIAGITGTSVPYVANIILSLQATGQLEEIKDGRKQFYKCIVGKPVHDTQTYSSTKKVQVATSGMTNVIQQFPVAERFDFVQKLTQMVLEKTTPSLFLTGSSGIGKTFLVTEQLKRNNLNSPDDYCYIKGHVSPMGLYTTLYYNQNKIVVFDDCDKAFENEISLGLLEAALDSYDKRILKWISRAIPLDGELPQEFEFNGGVIFVSNTNIDQIETTLRTRTMCINLAMTRKEITEHMRNLLPMIETQYPLEMRMEVMDYLEEIQEVFLAYNLRTLIKATRIRSSYPDPLVWKPMIKVVAYNE